MNAGIPRLEFRIPRIRSTYRFTYAFHAREVRFERDSGDGFEGLFPETFSFHAERHDPTELYLRIEDLWSNPARLGPGAGRRDAEELVLRLLAALPAELEGVLRRLAGQEARAARVRAAEDVAVFALVVKRFEADKGLEDHPRLRSASLYLRKLALRALLILVQERVRPEALVGYVAGRVAPAHAEDPHDISFFYALAAGDADEIDLQVLGATESAYHHWLEDVCLDEENPAFEGEGSPFESRESEVRQVLSVRGDGAVKRGRDLSPFLRRPANRDCLRLLEKLETWFLRRYDVHHAAAMRHQAAALRGGQLAGDRVLSRHGTLGYLMLLGIPALPFVGAIFAYQRAPRFFDWWATSEVLLVGLGAAWFLLYKFMWQRDLRMFHASVPRIAAGIIVGYLPVFLIDEVWDLAEQPAFYVLSAVVFLGSTTLLYLFVEVQRRLGDPDVAFARASNIFLLGLVQAAGFGLLITSLLGRLMVGRNWGPPGGPHTLEALRGTLTPFLGELPRVIGVLPFPAYPSAVLLMSFMAFFIGTFLQLLWEELPMTEPL